MNKLSVSSFSSSDSAYYGDQQCLSNSSTGGLALENIVLYFFLEAKLLHNLASLNSVSHWVYYFFLLYFGLSSYCKYSYIADCLFFFFLPIFLTNALFAKCYAPMDSLSLFNKKTKIQDHILKAPLGI